MWKTLCRELSVGFLTVGDNVLTSFKFDIYSFIACVLVAYHMDSTVLGCIRYHFFFHFIKSFQGLLMLGENLVPRALALNSEVTELNSASNS